MMLALEITDYIPQRKPFVMIDGVKNIDENSIETVFSPGKDNVMVSEGYFTSGGIMENIAQSAAFFAGYSYKQKGQDVPLGFITSIKGLKIDRFPKFGENISTKVVNTNEVLDFQIFHGEVKDNQNILIAECEIRVFIQRNQ